MFNTQNNTTWLVPHGKANGANEQKMLLLVTFNSDLTCSFYSK